MAFDPTAAMQAFSQAQLQQQREYFANQNRRLDMSGNVIDPTTGKGPGNPFDTGFFKSSAAQLTPQQLAQSQGGNAMNQWRDPMQFQGQAPAQQQNPMSFGQQTQASLFVMPQAPSANAMDWASPDEMMAQNRALYAPGGFRQPPAQTFNMQPPQQPRQSRLPSQRRLGSGRRPGSSFGFNASPGML